MTKKGFYAVAGVTGNTGSVVAETLLEKGANVRVIVREKSKGDPWKDRGAEVAVADLEDASALAEALRETDGAYLLSPPDFTSKNPLASRRGLIDKMADAVEKSGVPHVVFLSSIGAHVHEGTGVIRTLHYAEQRFGELAAATTFVRAAFFTENWLSVLGTVKSDGVLPTFFKADLAIDHVATADIGRVAAEALLGGKGSGKTIELAGPTPVSPNDVAKILGDQLGREVTVNEVPQGSQISTLESFGFSKSIAELFFEMYRGFENENVRWENESNVIRGNVTVDEVFSRYTK